MLHLISYVQYAGLVVCTLTIYVHVIYLYEGQYYYVSHWWPYVL